VVPARVLEDLRAVSPGAGNRELAAALRRAKYAGAISDVLAGVRGEHGPVSDAAHSVSSRSSHTFDNGPKTMTRERNLLALVEQAGELWDDDRHGRLRCDWCELTGQTGALTLSMLERAGVLAASGFVGIDREPSIIAGFAAKFPSYKWVTGDIMDALRNPALRRVGVLNHDGYEMVGSSRTRPVGRLVAEVARRSIRRFGAAVVFWNSDLDAVRVHGKTFSSALAEHARTIADVLGEALPARRRLAPEMLLPRGAEGAVDDPAFTGMLGSIEVYRGKSTGHRMCNVRLILR
jgi:hypothetical protein